MSGSQIWDAIDDLRAKVGLALTQLAEIKALLGERCAARELRICALERGLSGVGAKVDDIERRMIRMGVITGAVASLGSAVATAVIIKFAGVLLG